MLSQFLMMTCASQEQGDVTINDIAFGIWTGKKMIKKRILGLAKTWLKLVPQIDIYSDFLDEDDAMLVLNSSNHLNITFHTIPTYAHHIVGTSVDNIWNHAQSRHLIAFSDLYYRYPDKKWYFLGDDDTFLFPSGILKKLNQIDYNQQKILGHEFFIFPNLLKFFQSKKENYVFCQGGAGFFVTKAMMDFIAPRILNCSKYYEASNFVSDIRIAACIDFYTNITNFSRPYQHYIDQASLINGEMPEFSVPKLQYDTQPISFHHIVYPRTELLWNSSFSTWIDKNGTELLIEWTHIFASHIHVEIGYEGNFMHFIFGYMLDSNYDKNPYYSTSPPEPIFDNNSQIPRRFMQKYQGGISIEYICDDTVLHGNIAFDHFLGGNLTGTAFRVKCDQPQTYMHNFKDGSPFILLHEDQSDL